LTKEFVQYKEFVHYTQCINGGLIIILLYKRLLDWLASFLRENSFEFFGMLMTRKRLISTKMKELLIASHLCIRC